MTNNAMLGIFTQKYMTSCGFDRFEGIAQGCDHRESRTLVICPSHLIPNTVCNGTLISPKEPRYPTLGPVCPPPVIISILDDGFKLLVGVVLGHERLYAFAQPLEAVGVEAAGLSGLLLS